MTVSTRGGKREGSGRKPTGRTERKTFFLSPDCVDFLSKFKNESEVVEHAVRTCLAKQTKHHLKTPSGLSLGQIHVRNIINEMIPKYDELIERRDSEDLDEWRGEHHNFLTSIQEELFKNYFVHTDPITAQPLDESLISHHYLKYLYETGKKETLEDKGLKVRLDRHFYQDESDWPGREMSIYDLAFQGGHHYDTVYYHLFELAKKGFLKKTWHTWEVVYYKQDGIIEGHGHGSSQLLAHVLWGEPEISPSRIYIIDREPDPELNNALIYWDYFFRYCNKIAHKESNKGGRLYRDRRFHFERNKSYEEQGELIKEVKSYLEKENEKELKFTLQQALMKDSLHWTNGYSNQEWFSIYDILGLIREVQTLMERPYWHTRNPLILNIVNTWNHPERISTSLEDWYYDLSKT